MDLDFAALACNRTSNCVAWLPATAVGPPCVAYGGQNVVAILDPATFSVRTLLAGHTGMVNCVCWACPGDHAILLTAGSDGNAVAREQSGPFTFGAEKLLDVSSSSITGMAAMAGSGACLARAVACSGDGLLHTLDLGKDGGWQVVSRYEAGRAHGFNAVALSRLPQGPAVLAAAGLDNRVHLFTWSAASAAWRPAASLPGHMDWSRALSFRALAPDEAWNRADAGLQLLLASGAQDGRVRVWRFASHAASPTAAAAAEAGEAGDDAIGADGDVEEKEEGSVSDEGEDGAGAAGSREDAMRTLRDPDGGGTCCDVILETVLFGHEDWVTGLQWLPRTGEGAGLGLVTCSIDGTVLEWRPETTGGAEGVDLHAGAEQSLWSPSARLGGAGGQRAGFFGLALSPDGSRLAAHSYAGGFFLWGREGAEDWRPEPALGGALGGVRSVAWDPRGRYLCAVCSDMTVRVFAPHTQGDGAGRWIEVARPLSHGHPLVDGCLLPHNPGRGVRDHTLLVAAEEKALRVYEGTSVFVDALSRLAGRDTACGEGEGERAVAAAVPELGLTSKAFTRQQLARVAEEGGPGSESGLTREAANLLEGPPLESRLAAGTLWPEAERLYGHGHPALAVACNGSGGLVATSCRARSADHAAVKLWDTASWRQCGELCGHATSVVQLAFSRSGRWLLTVSRDRHICVFDAEEGPLLEAARRSGDGDGDWSHALHVVAREPVFRVPKAHRRIVWSGSWSHDDKLVASGSRDATVKLWRCKESGDGEGARSVRLDQASVASLGGAVTAVAFAPVAASAGPCARYVLATGLEDGRVLLWALDLVPPAEQPAARTIRWTRVAGGAGNACLAGTVHRLAWRPPQDGAPLQLAACGEDGSVRLYSVDRACLAPAEDARAPEGSGREWGGPQDTAPAPAPAQ